MIFAPSALQIFSVVSRVGLFLPDSMRDRFAIFMPVISDNARVVIPRALRSFFSLSLSFIFSLDIVIHYIIADSAAKKKELNKCYCDVSTTTVRSNDYIICISWLNVKQLA